MSKLRIGVFGGARGNTMIKVLLGHPDAELVAVCDKYQPLLDRVKKEAAAAGTEVCCYDCFDEFIRHDGLDAVVLANYANEHATYAVRCLEAGKHVLSEVLPCETMAQAVALIEAVERTGLVYAYAENYCYRRDCFEMWRRYRNGDIGTVQYGEGEYVHDCSSIWPQITYGERSHWRNTMHANFYCTHSIGPLIAMTGLRPVRVTGFETPPPECLRKLGSVRGAGVELVVMENGAVFKSLHGDLKREPSSVNYELYCTGGMMESGRLPENRNFNIYTEGNRNCHGIWEKYDAESQVCAEERRRAGAESHGGSDFYPTHFFIERILGRPLGAKWGIDVYTAVDMGICGILGYRSVLAGNAPVDIPDLRDPAQRDKYRNDNACTTPEVAGDQLLPRTSFGEYDTELPDEVYDRVRDLWQRGENA